MLLSSGLQRHYFPLSAQISRFLLQMEGKTSDWRVFYLCLPERVFDPPVAERAVDPLVLGWVGTVPFRGCAGRGTCVKRATVAAEGETMSYSRHQQKFLYGATLQSRRWLMEQRLEAVEQNDMKQLTELFSSKRPFRPAELTTALETAVLKKSDEYSPCVELLLEKGANPEGVNGLGTPFLYIAADAGCELTVHLLLAARADPNQCREDGTTALHRAVWNDHRGIIGLLLQAGADTEQCDMQGRTPLILATQRDRCESLELLLQGGANQGATDKKGRSGLYWAARYNNIASILALLTCDVDVDEQDVNHYTPLMVAAERGYKDVVELLLDHDVETDTEHPRGLSALTLATSRRHLDCVQLLVDFGADVNVEDGSGITPLLYLLDDSHLVYHLLEAGADPNRVVPATGQTAELLTVAGNSYDTLKILLQLNCDFLRAGANGRIPLDDALRRGYFECVQLLYTATVCTGGDLHWLRTKLSTLAINYTATTGSQVERCHGWLGHQLKANSDTPSLYNLTRGRLRKCIDSIFFEDNVQSLPIPKVLQNTLKLQELDELLLSSDEP